MKLGDFVQSVGQSLPLHAQDLCMLRVCVCMFMCYRYEERTVRESSIHTSTVQVVNVSAALDYAVFSCTARNSLGEDRLDIQLVSTSIVSMHIQCFLCVWVRASDRLRFSS